MDKGEIAFIKHNTIPELVKTKEFSELPTNYCEGWFFFIVWFFVGGVNPQDFELLCKDGRRMPLNEYQSCNWGQVPSDAIVVSSAVPFDVREKYQKFLIKFAEQ